MLVEKLVENRLKWFWACREKNRRCRRKKSSQMKESLVKRGRGKPRKTIRETIKNDLEVNELNPYLVYDRTLWRNLIHVANPI